LRNTKRTKKKYKKYNKEIKNALKKPNPFAYQTRLNTLKNLGQSTTEVKNIAQSKENFKGKGMSMCIKLKANAPMNRKSQYHCILASCPYLPKL